MGDPSVFGWALENSNLRPQPCESEKGYFGGCGVLPTPILSCRFTTPLAAPRHLLPFRSRTDRARRTGVRVGQPALTQWDNGLVRSYSIVLMPEEAGGFSVSVPALPGCFTQGETVEECRQRAVEAIAVYIEGLEADGEAVPEEVSTPRLSKVTVA